MPTRTIHVTVDVQVPEEATHYYGDLLDHPTFYFCKQIGVAGDHWFYRGVESKGWKFASHHKPHFINELPMD